MIHHLAPNGRAGFVLANGSMSSNTDGEGEIRKAFIEADLVDYMVALPGQMFYTTQIPVCLWFLDRDKSRGTGTGRDTPERDRRGETLFIDARNFGHLIDRTHRALSEEELNNIAGTYHTWRSTLPEGANGRLPDSDVQPGNGGALAYEDIPGFFKSATLDEIHAHDYVLTPGRYVGLGDLDEDDEPFEEKMERLTAELDEQFEASAQLEQIIRNNLEMLGGV